MTSPATDSLLPVAPLRRGCESSRHADRDRLSLAREGPSEAPTTRAWRLPLLVRDAATGHRLVRHQEKPCDARAGNRSASISAALGPPSPRVVAASAGRRQLRPAAADR